MGEASNERLTSDELLRRLAEAEETLAAIGKGEVDAVVVEGPRGQQVYSLESQDQPYRIFIERMQEGAVSLAEDGVVLYANAFFARLLLVPLEQVIGSSLLNRVHPDFQQAFHSLVEQGLRGSVRGALRLCAADGTVVPVSAALNPLPIRSPRTCAMVLTDLSEQERLKRVEAAGAAAVAANLAKDQFLAVLSHELRAPLNAILGWARILRTGSVDAATLKEGLETIERNSKVQAQLIDDLLDVSRIISGKLRLEMQQVHPAEVVDAALAAIAPAAAAKGICLERSIEPTAGPVNADPARLQQVVWNLVSNAIKFTPQGGKVRLVLHRKQAHAEIQVVDDGQGIRPEFLPFLFDPFRQADASTTRRHGGLGLGLSIVRQLVELHGGTVHARSAGEGCGSTFSVTLPLLPQSGIAPPPETCPAERPMQGGLLRDIRVLVVDDEPDARELIRRILHDWRADVRTAGSVPEALEILDGYQPDVILSDIAMPDQDGFDLIRQVRARGRSAKDLPAVALTAFARAEDRRRALLGGFQIHVVKPVEPGELVAVVASLVGRTGN